MDIMKAASLPGQALRQAQAQGTCRRWQGERVPYLERDVVCGMQVEPETAPAVRVHRGETYYFCSGSCAKEFEADPYRFILDGEKLRRPDAPQIEKDGTIDPIP